MASIRNRFLCTVFSEGLGETRLNASLSHHMNIHENFDFAIVDSSFDFVESADKYFDNV